MKKKIFYCLLTVLITGISLGSAKADVEEAPGGPGGVSGDCKPPLTNKCIIIQFGFKKTIDGVLTITIP